MSHATRAITDYQRVRNNLSLCGHNAESIKYQLSNSKLSLRLMMSSIRFIDGLDHVTRDTCLMNSYYGRLAPFCKLASDRPLPPARIDDSKCSMKIHYHSFLEGAKAARGTAVIIDVFRAFTCTPLLFSLGIQKSILVGTPQEAFALKQAWKDVLLIGETGGMPIEGFDLGNSPSEILRQEPSFFKGRTIVQRTSAGVQGALAALGGAEAVLVAGFTVARATADYILSKKPPLVSLVAMGWELKERAPEDECCARYIAHLLGAGDYDHNGAMHEILSNETAQRFLCADNPHFPAEDPVLCLQRDVYDFALHVERDQNLVVVHKIST